MPERETRFLKVKSMDDSMDPDTATDVYINVDHIVAFEDQPSEDDPGTFSHCMLITSDDGYFDVTERAVDLARRIGKIY